MKLSVIAALLATSNAVLLEGELNPSTAAKVDING
jgi:hypothetical protein